MTLFVGGALPPSAAQAPPQAGLRILAREGTRTLPTTVQSTQEYVALDDLTAAFGVAVREDRLAGGLTITAGSRSIIVTPDQPVVSVAGRLVSLTTPPVRQGTRWLLPLDFLSRALGPALDTRLDVRRPSRLLIVGDLRVPRVTTRVETSATSAVVTFDAAPPTGARVTLETGRLVVSFDADALDLGLTQVPPQDYLHSLQAGDSPTTVRLTTGPKFAVHRAASSQPDSGTSRLVVTLLPATTDAPPTPGVAPPAAAVTPPASTDPLTPPIVQPPGVRTVVIDAGHGGDDVGTRGAGGILEKDVTLAVARRLRTLIESRLGLRVFLTREDDRAMTLDERSAYANSQKADVFISLHANAAFRPTVKGAEVYYLGMDVTEADTRRLAESSGAVLPALGGGTRAVDLIPWDTAQSRYLDRSALLAGIVEQALRVRVNVSARAAQQAPFRVLVGANMPAVLVEIGYLSNVEQQRALGSGTYQDQVAQALFDAIAQFRARHERAAPAAAPQPPRTQP